MSESRQTLLPARPTALISLSYRQRGAAAPLPWQSPLCHVNMFPDSTESHLGNTACRGEQPWHRWTPVISLPLTHFKFRLVLQFLLRQPRGSDFGSTDHPLPRTQAFWNELVICVASYMQINRPTLKVAEQSTQITFNISANSHCQGLEVPERSLREM